MANIKLVNNYWETSGVYDIAEGKTQRQVNSSKMNKPTVAGTSGQILRSDGNGGSVWDNAATQSEIGDAVTEWLDDNVPTGQTVVVDASLSVSGAAADSKTTGDKIAELSTALSFEAPTIGWEQGALKQGDGGNQGSTTRIRLTRYVGKHCGIVSAKANSGYEFTVACYNSDGVYQGLICTDNTFKKSGTVAWITYYNFANYSNGEYKFRVVLRNATTPTGNITVSESTNCLFFTVGTDRELIKDGIAADAKVTGESLETLSSGLIKKRNAVKLNAPDGIYSNLNVWKRGNVIVTNETFTNDYHKFNLTGTTILDKSAWSACSFSNFPEAYVDDIPEFIIGHYYLIHLYAFDGSYTLDNPDTQFCYLGFGNKANTLNLTTSYPNNSVFYCSIKPQGLFIALRAGTYNCKIGVEIIDITEETAQPEIGKNLLQVFDKITGIGDSLMAGYTSSTDPATDSATARARGANWLSYLGSDIGRTVTNLAVGSSSWKDWRNGTGNTDITDANIDTNCYLVGLGVNDSIQENTVGTSSDIAEDKSQNADSVYGNADFVIRTLHGYNANAHIFVFTSPASKTNSDDINDAIRYIANLYNYVHCIDIDALYRNGFRYGVIKQLLSDGTHYEPLGYRIIANYITSAIDSFMLSNYSLFLKVPYEL